MNTTSLLVLPGLGGQAMIFIFLALLLLFGARKIPELARSLGKGITEFKDATNAANQTSENGLN